jgi:hypothetical protein
LLVKIKFLVIRKDVTNYLQNIVMNYIIGKTVENNLTITRMLII